MYLIIARDKGVYIAAIAADVNIFVITVGIVEVDILFDYPCFG